MNIKMILQSDTERIQVKEPTDKQNNQPEGLFVLRGMRGIGYKSANMQNPLIIRENSPI
jgi:hypothetical protein